jgi:NADH:quinone reductase (non-electrogenic)
MARHELSYDYLIVALGAQTDFRHGAGSEEHAFPLYTMSDAFLLRNHVLQMLELADLMALK